MNSSYSIQILCLVLTLLVYFLNKQLYRRWHILPFMPLVFTPVIMVIFVLVTKISWQNYSGESHWLVWLLGPATVAFAVPVYENIPMIRRHWLSISGGVVTAVLIAVTTSVWLARLFELPENIQRSLAVRSVTTPFALAAVKSFNGIPDLAAFFVVLTGVFGVAVGDILFIRLSIRHGTAKGAGFGGASHGAGTARSWELGAEEGVVASLVMMFAGVCMVLSAPVLQFILF
ncbi:MULTISPECIES: LrgB family protein [Tenebrionibacter/Tenebrionicola group]|jgi:predicted murein hydrolase (TIGR00659 family)|uniref:LrgB family protein n=2 Tax=Tenebrionibacter/Tenebrionicola group TaxID=2969848 RepID=A0A8K0V348_9ENTR|nr:MULTISPECIES: LrgB family protein [Tenebrionibacter/Tenebrionicola group]MBK4715961.1 LrgB family protein [Tenebrionibacter intestinalis]MBV5096859.1 LrgB family protein [Tenebrionicola larvae]